MFDQKLWRRLIHPHGLRTYPTLPCPYCGAIALSVDLNSLSIREYPATAGFPQPAEKMVAHRSKILSDAMKSENLLGILGGVAGAVELVGMRWSKFIAFFTCDQCGKSVASIGTASRSHKLVDDDMAYSLKVDAFSPPVLLFKLQSVNPASVNAELTQAFAYFHSDLTASGAKLRRAVEKFCDELGYGVGTLHKRIEALRSSFPIEGELLSTLKLVGNEATHSDGIDEEDLLLAFDLFEVCLDIFRRKESESRARETLAKLDSKFRKPSP